MKANKESKGNIFILLVLLALLLICSFPAPVEALEKQTPATITIGGKKYVTQEYVVKKGDWISKLLRQRGVLEGTDLYELPALLKVIKDLNRSLASLDRIKPGQRIVILAKAPPEKSTEAKKPKTAPTTAPQKKPATTKTPAVKTPSETKKPQPALRQELKYEKYTVAPGDWLSSIVVARHNISLKTFFREYLPLFKRANPSIKDPDNLNKGQVIRLPFYPPQFAEKRDTRTLISRLVTDAPSEKDAKAKAEKPVTEPAMAPKEKPSTVKKPKPAPAPPTAIKTDSVSKPAPVTIEDIAPTPPKKKTLPAASGQTPEKPRTKVNPAVYHLGRIFSAMGEEWVQSGEHFIPLKSGTGVHFKATKFPMVNPQKSRWVIVDPSNTFPDKLAKLIGSTWDHYRVVHLKEEDDLKTAVGKVLKASGYPKVFEKGEPLELRGDVDLRVTGDWIVTRTEPGSGEKPSFVVINLIESDKPRTPEPIKNYLAEMGVKSIEYPPVRGQAPAKTYEIEKTQVGPNRSSLIETLLTMMGLPFSSQTEVHVYQDKAGDLRFVVTADYYLKIKGKNAIIDLTGMSAQLTAYLADQGLRVLDLTTVGSPMDTVIKTLTFCGVTYNPGPHPFTATAGDKSRNVGMIIPGVVFSDRRGKKVLASQRELSDNLVAFLTRKGYRYLALPPSKTPLEVKATVLPSPKTQNKTGGK
jgi:hypothetical protein